MEVTSSNKSQKILITGGGGLLGRYLTSLLLSEGYAVSHLSRQQNAFGKVRVYRWDPEKKILDNSVLGDVNCIIHLAGEEIWGKRWSEEQKVTILKSRVDSARFLHEKISNDKTPLKAFISSSAVEYYGSVTSEKIFSENDPPGRDFLGSVCKEWEASADLFSKSGIRAVKIRSAVVLEKNSGALARLVHLADYGIFSSPGKGEQYLPWIHINDLCSIYLKVIEETEREGP